jgi:hypothetical chaperone protein
MTAIGIDYGTSNSEVVHFDGKKHQFIKLDPAVENENKILSSVFIYYEHDLPTPPVAIIDAKVAQLKRVLNEQLDKAKDAYFEAPDPRTQAVYSDKISDLQSQFHNLPALQRRAIALLLKDMTVQDISLNQLVETGKFAFGQDGFTRYLKTPEKGRLIYSPKNFLGANLVAGQRQAFVGIIAKQLAYFRQCAQNQLNQEVSTAVIGRPVKYHGTNGEKGNAQALDIMQQAAEKAGFTHVKFVEEPIAAAYKIEQTLQQATNTLVVDIGGGTTDICCIQLAPNKTNKVDRQNDVLSVTGARLGGMECDKNLISKAIAPSLGLGLVMTNGLPVPPTYFSDMCAVDNIPKLENFFSEDYALEIAQTKNMLADPEQLTRLEAIQENKLSARLVNSARLAKELLSSKTTITLPLHYVEDDFSVDITREKLNASMVSWLRQVEKLIKACLEKSEHPPQMLFMTGGMSLSPLVREEIQKMMPNELPLLQGDAFNSVCEGLAIEAYNLHN